MQWHFAELLLTVQESSSLLKRLFTYKGYFVEEISVK